MVAREWPLGSGAALDAKSPTKAKRRKIGQTLIFRMVALAAVTSLLWVSGIPWFITIFPDLFREIIGAQGILRRCLQLRG